MALAVVCMEDRNILIVRLLAGGRLRLTQSSSMV